MAGQLTIDTLKASSGVLATQNGMTGIAKAWVNFNGSTATVVNSFNVSSVTRSSTGNYGVNYTTALPISNYAACGMIVNASYNSGNAARSVNANTLTTTGATLFLGSGSGAAEDQTTCFIAFSS